MLRMICITAAILGVGSLGGAVASYAPVPLPWMLGSLLTSGVCAVFLSGRALRGYVFPNRFRTYFIALIGVMIGTQVTPALMGQLVHLPWTVPGLLLFVVVAHLGNYTLYHRLGGLDRATSYYAGAPGGLMESILMGEAAGAHIQMLTLLQFMRIILVITLVPIGLSIWVGGPVGSAAGMTVAAHPGSTAPIDIVAITVTAGVGLMLAQWVHLPASQLVGPLLLAGGLTLAGVWDLHLPGWMIAMAQVVVGTSLGLRFQGMARAQLGQALRLSTLSVSAMLCLGAGVSWGLTQVTGVPMLHLLISFAPGGVTEMSIIALSLAANPALVSAHHVIRILLTVGVMGLMAKRVSLASKEH